MTSGPSVGLNTGSSISAPSIVRRADLSVMIRITSTLFMIGTGVATSLGQGAYRCVIDVVNVPVVFEATRHVFKRVRSLRHTHRL